MVKEDSSTIRFAHAVQLDGLRCIAIVMVLIAHWEQWKFSSPILKSFPFSHGVTLFFVLSGFLITRILLAGRDANERQGQGTGMLFKAFYLRRVLRIFPIYYLLIFGLFAANYKNVRDIFPWLVTYTTNIYQAVNMTYIGDFNHFWSLAAEEQFYLFWPLLMVFLPRKHLMNFIMLMIVGSVVFRISVFLSSSNWMAIVYSTPGCMHALGLGALAAYLQRYRTDTLQRLTNGRFIAFSFATYLAAYIVCHFLGPYWYKDLFDEVLFAFVSMLTVIRAAENGFSGAVKSVLENRMVAYTGRISYGIYVFHLFIPPLAYWLLPQFGFASNDGYGMFPLFFSMTWLSALLSWKLIEEPINRLKTHVAYLRTANG